ncbi:prephenate dehydratase [Candida albicans GC75]|nr:prephenate dehydratase [Candida albicans GC75]KHC43662.1 prephenate dehydratase [Candida albicans Ca6]KHC69990.1 prephenate dehydratase [Candida albicans P75016]
MTIKVAFLGPEGTYTHQALIQQFGTENVSIYPQQSIGDCFHILNEKKVDYAVVPFENSTNGQVVFTYDLLRDWYFQTSTPPKFRIIAEQFVSIHHNLLTNASKIEDIKTIYSHPQVWTQVNKFLQSLPQQITKIDVGSTSKAAEIVSQDTITTSGSSSAAISSYMSSELYKLPILKEGIEDNQSNTTRFLILGYDSPISPPPPSASNNDDDNSKRNTTIVSSIMFTLNHDDPGALCDVLVKFKEYGITLTSINSRPANLKPWQYVFFVEMIGDIHQEGLVEKIKESCLELVILGVFQRSWRYNNNSNDQ